MTLSLRSSSTSTAAVDTAKGLATSASSWSARATQSSAPSARVNLTVPSLESGEARITVTAARVELSGLRRLAAIHEDSPATSILLAFSDRPDASLREIVQAGADDILRLPFDSDDLVIALERALDIGSRRLAGVCRKRRD